MTKHDPKHDPTRKAAESLALYLYDAECQSFAEHISEGLDPNDHIFSDVCAILHLDPMREVDR